MTREHVIPFNLDCFLVETVLFIDCLLILLRIAECLKTKFDGNCFGNNLRYGTILLCQSEYQFHDCLGDYRYHELRPFISYFPCHWVVPVDFPNTCPMKIVRIFYRIIARYGRDIYTLTHSFPNQQ